MGMKMKFEKKKVRWFNITVGMEGETIREKSMLR